MTPKGIIYLVSFALVGISGTTSAGNLRKGDSIMNLKIERESATGRSLRAYYTVTPATMNFADTANFSTAALTAESERLGRAVVVQNGRGHDLYGLSAESYYKLSPEATVWGHAAYHNGSTRDITFCDVVDYETVAPFVVGDDTGGNIRRQRYDFGGGWARTYNAWSIGLNADYRAEIAYRPTDPRIRDIVSDLNVGIGGARQLGERYLLGLNCGIRVYHQDSDVDFYNPVTHAITMVYTGLGDAAKRFKGADAQSASNRLTGFRASLQLVPRTHSDNFYAVVCGETADAGLILNGYNNLKFGTVATKSVSAQVSRLVTAGQLSFFPSVSIRYIDRVATENLFGSSAENYEKIGERKNYHHSRFAAALSLPASWRTPDRQAMLSADIRLACLSDKEGLIDPDRRLATDYLTGSITLEATKRIGSHWALGVSFGHQYRAIMSTSARWGALDLTSPEGAAALSNYEMASCEAEELLTGITASRAVKTMVIGLSLQYVRHDFKHLTDGNRFAAGLSITF